jgi:hypothetical protein
LCCWGKELVGCFHCRFRLVLVFFFFFFFLHFFRMMVPLGEPTPVVAPVVPTPVVAPVAPAVAVRMAPAVVAPVAPAVVPAVVAPGVVTTILAPGVARTVVVPVVTARVVPSAATVLPATTLTTIVTTVPVTLSPEEVAEQIQVAKEWGVQQKRRIGRIGRFGKLFIRRKPTKEKKEKSKNDAEKARGPKTLRARYSAQRRRFGRFVPRVMTSFRSSLPSREVVRTNFLWAVFFFYGLVAKREDRVKYMSLNPEKLDAEFTSRLFPSFVQGKPVVVAGSDFIPPPPLRPSVKAKNLVRKQRHLRKVDR